MAKAKAQPAPQYGDLKPRVIEFLRELLMTDHEPESAIGIWPREGRRNLGFRCARCKRHITVPETGEMNVPPCLGGDEAKGGGHGSAHPLFSR